MRGQCARALKIHLAGVKGVDDIEFRILGPVEALDGERRVPLGAPKQRALLATLLLHAGEV